MNKVEKIFNVTLWKEGAFDPSNYQHEAGAGEPTTNRKTKRWRLLGTFEEFIQRITGLFWSDNSARTREDLAVVSDIRNYSEQLKGSEKRLAALELQVANLRKTDQPVPAELRACLEEARKDWEKVTQTLQTLKSNYSRNPHINKTTTYRKLSSLEKAIDARLKRFMYTNGNPEIVKTLQEAQDFEHAFYYNTLLFPFASGFMDPAQKLIEALQEIVRTPSKDANPFNCDLQDQARLLISQIRQEMIDTYLTSRRRSVPTDVKTFVDVQAHMRAHFTPEMKSLLRSALTALKSEDPKGYDQAIANLTVLKDEQHLEYLSALFKSYGDKQKRDVGLQALYSKVSDDLETIRNIPVQQCLQHIQAAVAGLRDCPHIMKFLEEFARSKEKREQLMNRIQPAGYVANLLMLNEMMQPYFNDDTTLQARRELAVLKRKALNLRMEGLSAEGRGLLERTQALIAIPFTSKLALVGALGDGEFCKKFRRVLDLYEQKPSLEQAASIWRAEIHPLLMQPPLEQKVKALNILGPLLAASLEGGQLNEAALRETFAYGSVETQKFVESHAQSRGLSDETKTMLRDALVSLYGRDRKSYDEATKKLGSLKDEAYLNHLSSLLIDSEEPSAKAQEEITVIRQALADSCVRYVQKCLPGIETNDNLMLAVTQLASTERQHLMDYMRPGREVDNLLVLAHKMPSSEKMGGIEPEHRARKELEERIQDLIRVQAISPESQSELERVQVLFGSRFPIPLRQKIALIAALQDSQFCVGFGKVLDCYERVRSDTLAEGLHQGVLASPEAHAIWQEQISPLKQSDQVRRELEQFRLLLQSKIGMGEPTLLEQNIPTAILGEETARQNTSWSRPIANREGVMQKLHLNLYDEDEKRLLSRGGFNEATQLGCYEYFSCQPGEFRFAKETFKLGYGLPGVGVTLVEVSLDLSDLNIENSLVLCQFMMVCMTSTLPQLEEKFKDPEYRKALAIDFGLQNVEELTKRVLAFKRESDRLLRGAHMALGNPDLPPIEGVAIIPW